MPEPSSCVFCRRRPIEPAWRPFCSERCKLEDLAAWAGGAYRVAAEPLDIDENAQDDANRTSEF